MGSTLSDPHRGHRRFIFLIPATPYPVTADAERFVHSRKGQTIPIEAGWEIAAPLGNGKIAVKKT